MHYWLLTLLTLASLTQAGHKPMDFVASLEGRSDAGKLVYQQFCGLCHAQDPDIKLGAPRYRVRVDWQSRLKQGIGNLLKNTNNGMNAMPPRGGCFECSDEHIRAAIVYMLPKERKSAL